MSFVSYLHLACVAAIATVAAGKEGWQCVDGLWHDGSAAYPEYGACEGSKGGGDKDDSQWEEKESAICSVANAGLSVDSHRTCILSAPSGTTQRCWWTYEPASLPADEKVPLVIDMHGGGGCAAHQADSSGYRALADVERFIVAWPQGHNSLWASCGSDCFSEKGEAVRKSENKDFASWNDIQFIESLIATAVGSVGSRIDAERVYLSGFSLGCMMSHRMAMEKSDIVAGISCHGGELSLVDENTSALDAYKVSLGIMPMPVLSTIGTNDVWFSGAARTSRIWAYWNGCSEGHVEGVKVGAFDAEKVVNGSCAAHSPPIESVFVKILQGEHMPEEDAAPIAYDFLKKYARRGAANRLPGPTNTIDAYDMNSSASGSARAALAGAAIALSLFLLT